MPETIPDPEPMTEFVPKPVSVSEPISVSEPAVPKSTPKSTPLFDPEQHDGPINPKLVPTPEPVPQEVHVVPESVTEFSLPGLVFIPSHTVHKSSPSIDESTDVESENE